MIKMDDNDNNSDNPRKSLRLISEDEMSCTDLRDIATNAGYEGRSNHKNTYKTERLSHFMTKILEDMLGESGDVKLYHEIYRERGIKPYDLTWKENGKDKIKIRHIYSILRIHKGSGIPYYEYQINYFRDYRHSLPNIFMLTGWIEEDNIPYLYPTRFWVINAKEKIKTQRTEMEFKDKNTFTVYETKGGITRMKKYEDNDKLEKLKKYKVDMTKFRST